MANYVFILNVDLANDITEHLGTDWVRRIDGRYNLASQIYEAEKVLESCDRYYKRPQPGYIIRMGSVNGRVGYKYIRPEFKHLNQDIRG